MTTATAILATTLSSSAEAQTLPDRCADYTHALELSVDLTDAAEGTDLVAIPTVVGARGPLRIGYSWNVQGNPIPGRSATLPAAAFERGDQVTVTATARDRCGAVQFVTETRIGPGDSGSRPAYAAIHLEPRDETVPNTYALDYQARHWPSLVEMVSSAETRGHRLTLMFAPQWIEYIGTDSARTDLFLSWSERGHELAVHHHGPANPDWDGFTDNAPMSIADSPDYRGTAEDMLAILEMLGTEMVSYNGSPDAMPQGMHTVAIGGQSESACFEDTFLEINGASYFTRGFKSVEDEHSVQDIEDGFAACPIGQTLGVSWHAAHYTTEPQMVERIFDAFAANGVALRALREI